MQEVTGNSYKRTLFHKQIFRLNFGMPFEVNNFAIRTRNVVLVSQCCFVSENVVFVLKFCVLIVEERSVLEIWFHFQNAVKLRNFAIWFQKCRFCFRKPFLSRKVVCISRFRWPLCATISRALRAEYCIVGIPHHTVIYKLLFYSFYCSEFTPRDAI